MIELHDSNPFRAPTTTDHMDTLRDPVVLSLYGVVGFLVGTVSFAQLIGCVCYYLGAVICLLDQQPLAKYAYGYAAMGGLYGAVIGGVLGMLAGIRLGQGWRPRLVAVAVICPVNIMALLGTNYVSVEMLFSAFTLQTILAGAFCGVTVGVIVSALLAPLPTAASALRRVVIMFFFVLAPTLSIPLIHYALIAAF